MLPISIIIPVFNAEKYLEKSIKSVLVQTFAEFELIIINDGSTDGSAKICDMFAEKDNRVRVIHQDNRGVSAARNTGISNAQGEYICFVDSDDFINEDMLECLYNNAIEYDADISCCGIVQTTLNGVENIRYCTGEKKLILDCKDLLRSFFEEPVYREVLYGPYNKIIRANIVKTVGFQERFRIAEDLLFNFECLEQANSFYFENRGLYHYIKRENSATTSEFSVKQFDYIYVADILLEKCCNNYSFAYSAALLWNYVHKINICRTLSASSDMKVKYREFYEKCHEFCKTEKRRVWKSLPLKKKIDYYLLNAIPDIYKIIE